MKGLFYRILFAWRHSFRSNNPGRWPNCWKASEFVFPDAPSDKELWELYPFILVLIAVALTGHNLLVGAI